MCLDCRDRELAITVMIIDAGTCGSTKICVRTIPSLSSSTFSWPLACDLHQKPQLNTTSLRNDIEYYSGSNGDDVISYTYTDSTNRPSASFPQSSNGTMPALPVPQQSDWSNNVYVIVTTRVFVMVGMAYLIKSLYHLLPSNWGTRSASIAAGRLSLASNPDLYTQEVWRSNSWHSLVIE